MKAPGPGREGHTSMSGDREEQGEGREKSSPLFLSLKWALCPRVWSADRAFLLEHSEPRVPPSPSSGGQGKLQEEEPGSASIYRSTVRA